MKTHQTNFSVRKAAFTLIEMIGVMAILAIMATVLTPNVLHSIERAAVVAEQQNLHNLGTEIGFYLRDNNGTWPASSPSLNWTTQLATYSSLSPADIQTNRRQMDRIYVADTVNRRALLISSMRNGVALPSAANITANFLGIWNTADGTVPPGTWTGWSAGTSGNIEYLVIERVSLSEVFQTSLQTYTLIINNTTGPLLSYRTVPAVGAASGVIPILAGSSGITVVLKPKDRLNLYRDSTGTTLNFSYVVSDTPRTFTYTAPNWIAQ